ncbi:MAG: glycoside hydrolase family 43 protein, partial [Chloroflexota bacterium]
VFHSKDLVNWRQIGHVLERPSQLNLDGALPSRGLYAPTIRHYDGTFYVINTHVSGETGNAENDDSCRNFIVTAVHPAGPWSEPYWLDDAPGIDPSLFFDENGRCWYTGNRIPPAGESYHGHREIWLQELDLDAMQLTGEKYSLWDGAVKGNVHAEAPHLYKIDGMYYLLVAEAGTEHNHAVTVARSQTITGPYENNPRNPILTHRHLGQAYPIVGTGHSDIVQTQAGEWWMVLLAMRPYDGYFYNLGRETFLVPLIWEDGWPIVSPGLGRVEFSHTRPALSPHPWPQEPARDDFDAGSLASCWNFLRTPRTDFWSLSERPGHLRLRLRPEKLSELVNPSFVGRRQQDIDFEAAAKMEFAPQTVHEAAGMVLLQNNDFHFRLMYTLGDAGTAVIKLIKRQAGIETVLGVHPAPAGSIYLKASAKGQSYNFYFGADPETWQPIAENVDGRILSTPVAGGFIGAYVGMYASGNGRSSTNVADFDWFEYRGLVD